MTGHISRPMPNKNEGQRYARQARRRQTSVPTTASASSSRPMIRKPAANHQWTNSARGSILRLFQVFDQAGCEQDREDEPGQDHVERRLREEPPEALSIGMKDRQPVGLDEGPRHSGEHRRRTGEPDCRGTQGSPSRMRRRRLGCEMGFHLASRRVDVETRPRGGGGGGGGGG